MTSDWYCKLENGMREVGPFTDEQLRKMAVGVGNALHKRLDEDFLISEADHIHSGLTGWLLKQYLTYPPLGKRIANLNDFCDRE